MTADPLHALPLGSAGRIPDPLLTGQPGGPALVDAVPSTATMPPSSFRFTPISPAAVRETGMAMPYALDLTSGASIRIAARADLIVDGVDAAVLNAVGRHAELLGVWRSWRSLSVAGRYE